MEIVNKQLFLVHVWPGGIYLVGAAVPCAESKIRVSVDHWLYDGADHDLAGRSKKDMP